MSMTPDMTDRRRRPAAFWVTPATSVVLGLVMAGAAWAGDQPGVAVFSLALMTGIAIALVVAAPHSETIGRLLDRRDERITGLDRDATTFAGSLLILAIIGGFVYELATGGDGQPYSWLGALAGVGYVAALITLRLRR